MGRQPIPVEISGQVFEGGMQLTVRREPVNVSGAGDSTLIAAVTGKRIRLLAAFLMSAGTTNVRFESTAGGTPISGILPLVANVGFVLPFNPVGWGDTVAGELLSLEISGGVDVDGMIVIAEV